MELTAAVIGGTGLVGSRLLRLLLGDPRFAKVVSFGRRKTGLSNAKLHEVVVDFAQPGSWKGAVQADVAFSALGTTLKQAGSKEAQRKVDFEYQLDFAKAARANGVKRYALCSSASANASSPMFYTRIKGELDRDVQALGFERVRIMRPSLLAGDRAQARTGEKVSSSVLGAMNAIGLFRRYREIDGEVVARAMIESTFDPAPGTRIYTLDEVFAAAGAAAS